MWLIEDLSGNQIVDREFDDKTSAMNHLRRMGSVCEQIFIPVYHGTDPFITKILNEGLMKNDMDNILLPRISVDEYTPSDPNTDNIVLGLYIKGVPDAVVPFKNFCEKCNGILDVDYSDSDLIPNASVVYLEMDRENLDMNDIHDLLEQVCMLTSFEINDFTMTFPHTDKKFPYSNQLLARYFESRTRRKNLLAQKKAEQESQKKANDHISQSQIKNESMISWLASL